MKNSETKSKTKKKKIHLTKFCLNIFRKGIIYLFSFFPFVIRKDISVSKTIPIFYFQFFYWKLLYGFICLQICLWKSDFVFNICSKLETNFLVKKSICDCIWSERKCFSGKISLWCINLFFYLIFSWTNTCSENIHVKICSWFPISF